MSRLKNMDTGKMEILIVEDSPTQALELQQFLENNSYSVSVANNGVSALSYLQKCTPKLIISDIVMPEMDGYELCRKIKSHDRLKSIPIILLTTLSEPEDIVNGLTCGAENFVTKPYDEKLLLSRIQYILVNQKLRQNPGLDMGMEVFFAGNKFFINSDRLQILDLLFSTYENTLQQKRKLERVNKELQNALDNIKELEGILPICAHCKKIRDSGDEWQKLEAYIEKHSEAQFSHGICPDCMERLYPESDGE